MKKIELVAFQHNTKIGDVCVAKTPNITEDSVFYENGVAIGFYLSVPPKKIQDLASIANAELRTSRVPKSKMVRGTKEQAEKKGLGHVTQFSTIIGSVPPKPHMRRPYPKISSVHSVKTAHIFIGAMLSLVKESELLIKQIMPDQYEKQSQIFTNVPEQWKFGSLFTSSISNYNISAPFHKDNGNIEGTVNVIICKRYGADGGNLHVPDYDITIGQKDGSILVYPAWKNVHGVTPIEPIFDGGYRNSLVFYPLKAFLEKK